jgi:cellulose synthase/poly-beta-1,6-N-acetylglucosamine synthase-like glycosyltransferase
LYRRDNFAVSCGGLLTPHHILFAIYLLLGPGAILGLLASLALGYSRMKRLSEQKYVAPTPAPNATILIPAKDEGGKIRECLHAILRQDYPNFDVIAIDDRSSDSTGAILDEIAAASSGKLGVVHIPQGGLPEGWAGKVHALHTGASRTTSPWLLFVDSDVLIEPDALSQLMGIATTREYDAVSILPRLACNSFLQKLVLPVAAGVWGVVHTISWTNDDALDVALANGQAFLIRREAYEKVGGHSNERVRHALAEDVQLMRAIKRAGFRTRFLLGNSIAATRMYDSFRQSISGWARIFATTNELSPWRILLAIAFILLNGLSGWAALIWGIYAFGALGQWHWVAASLVHSVLTIIYLIPTYRWSGNPRWCAILFPVSTIFLLKILFDALNLCRTGRITWRGTSYAFRESASRGSK